MNSSRRKSDIMNKNTIKQDQEIWYANIAWLKIRIILRFMIMLFWWIVSFSELTLVRFISAGM